MTNEYVIRKARPEDSSFIAEAIIAAEKSGTEKMSLSALFELPEPAVSNLLIAMLNEESSGCEFSLDSFLIMEHNGYPVAATAGWIENFGENIPSGKLKTNLVHIVFPKGNVLLAFSKAHLVKDVQIEREKHTLQVEYIYTVSKYRGKGLAGNLIDQHISIALASHPELKKVQVQVFKNNGPAIRLYERAGFSLIRSFKSGNKEILDYLPGNEKLLMEKVIK